MTDRKPARISLDEEAATVLGEMLVEVKNSGRPVKITPSQLVSRAVKYFHRNGFDRDRAKVVEEHLNRRQWLKNALRGAGEGDIEKVLRDALDGIKAKGKKRQRRLGE